MELANLLRRDSDTQQTGRAYLAPKRKYRAELWFLDEDIALAKYHILISVLGLSNVKFRDKVWHDAGQRREDDESWVSGWNGGI